MPTAIAPLSSAAIIAELGFTPANDAALAAHLADLANPHAVTKTQVGLSNVDNLQQLPLSYLDTDVLLSANSDVKVPSQKAVRAYADSLVVGLIDDRGNYDASGNVFPSTGGSGAAGAILKGDLWFISVGGTLSGVVVAVGDQVRALVDTPGQTAGNWGISEANIGFVPENVGNKATGFGTLNNTLYPTTQAVADYAQPLSANLTGLAALADPNADLLLFWDDSAGAYKHLTLGTNLSITDTTLNAAGGGGGASLALDNLASVNINTDLLFQATAGLGSATKPALTLFVGNTTQYESVSQSVGLITHAALGSATNIGFTFTPKGSGGLTLTSGRITVPAGTALLPSIHFDSAGTGWFGGSSTLNASVLQTHVMLFGTSLVRYPATYAISFSSSASLTDQDVGVKRSALGVLEVCDGLTSGNWCALKVGTTDSGTTTVTNGLTIGHKSTGTPAAGLGSGILFNINATSGSGADQNAAQIAAKWTDATFATRTSKLTIGLVNNAAALAQVAEFLPAALNLATGVALQINGTQVVGAQGAAVADATGAGDVVAQLNTLLARCRAHGLIAT